MVQARMISVICACGHRAEILASADCPSCGAPHSNRITRERMRVIAAIATRASDAPPVVIQPAMRIWLVDRDLISRGARTPPAAVRRHRRPIVRHELTPKCLGILDHILSALASGSGARAGEAGRG